MAKITLDNIGNFTSTTIQTINTNFDRIEDAMEKTLSRDGTVPNQMTADLDMNHQDLLNIGDLEVDNIIVDGQPLDDKILEIVQSVELTSTALPSEANSFLRRNPGNTAFIALGADEVRNALATPLFVETRTALKALDTNNDEVVHLLEPGREGDFKWVAGDFSAEVANDTQEGIYIAADFPAPTVGAWVRIIKDGVVDVDWWGATPDAIRAEPIVTTALSTTATSTAVTFTSADVGKKIFIHRGGAIGVDTRAMHLSTEIATVVGPNEITLVDPAQQTLSTVRFAYGTDSTLAWQEAIKSGYPVKTKPGSKYLVTAPLHNNGAMNSIVCQGGRSAIYAAYVDNDVIPGTESVFYNDGRDNLVFSGMIGEWFGYFKKSYISFYRHHKGHDLVISDCEASGFSSSGFLIGEITAFAEPNPHTTQRAFISNVYSHGHRTGGFYIASCKDLIVTGCRFEANGLLGDGGTGYGIAGLAGCSMRDVIIANCQANDNFRRGIDFHAGVGITIVGNTVLRNKIAGIYAEDTFITGAVLIADNIVGEMEWTGTIASGVPGEGSAPTMFGIHVGAQNGQGLSADPTDVTIANNIIYDFTVTVGADSQSAYPIFAHAGGWSFGSLKITGNSVRADRCTSIIRADPSTAGTPGNYYDIFVQDNVLIANECISIPIYFRSDHSRKKNFSGNTLTVTTVVATTGALTWDTTTATNRNFIANGNIVNVPAIAWSGTGSVDWIGLKLQTNELMRDNIVNNVIEREWDGVRFSWRGTGATPPADGKHWTVGSIWWTTNVVAAGSPGGVCTVAGKIGTWKAMANIAP